MQVHVEILSVFDKILLRNCVFADRQVRPCGVPIHNEVKIILTDSMAHPNNTTHLRN